MGDRAVRLLSILLLVAIVIPACAPSSTRGAADALRAQLDDDWKYWMTQYPEAATAVGYPGQNGRWTDYSIRQSIGAPHPERAASSVCRRSTARRLDPATS